MNVALLSLFRNSVLSGHLPRYLAQAGELAGWLLAEGHTLRIIAAEGDSIDNTRQALQACSQSFLPVETVDASHGGPVFGSVVDPQRMKQLAHTANAGLRAVRESDDVVIYVESDLVWDARTMMALIVHLVTPGIDIIAPFVHEGNKTGTLYDTFAFRFHGGGPFSFSKRPPYHEMFDPSCLNELASAGSCLVMKGKVARVSRFKDEEAVVGFCEHARYNGFRIFTDFRLAVRHPL